MSGTAGEPRRLDRSGFGATLVDLAARGWFEVRAPAGPAGSAGPVGPALCVVPAETPGGPLAPFKRRVVAHVALRAGARGEVPAPALSDGFGGGETEFMSAFREEVDAEARRLGLTRSPLSGRRIGLLLLLLFVPAGALIPVAAHGRGLDVSIGTERYRRLPPGTFVHARVNLRGQMPAVTNGLPDPADLVLETEAAAILGGKVRGSHLDGTPGRTMAWQPPSTGRPMLRVEVRHAADARRVPPTARPAPGVADGYLVNQGAAVTVSALTALISIHGSVHIASEASLAGLLPVVERRLRELVRRIDFNQY